MERVSDNFTPHPLIADPHLPQERVDTETCSFARSITHPGDVRRELDSMNRSSHRQGHHHFTNQIKRNQNLSIRPQDYAKMLLGKDLSYVHPKSLSFMTIRVAKPDNCN